jgi:arylsulfatase A-like enzyme
MTVSKTSLLFLLILLACGPLGRCAASQPNIIFFLSDDHRWDRMGCAGHSILKTPTLDSLAAGGVRFTNMFVTTSICAASRASILTGLYERSHRFTFGTPPIAAKLTGESYPALLRKAGYRTGFIGKFGVKIERGEREKMFDFFVGIGRAPYLKKQKDGSLRHESELCGDQAIRFIESNPEDKPFCLSVSFNASHAEDGDKRPGIGHFPWPKAVDGLYEDVEIPDPLYSAPEIFEAHPEFMKKSMNRQRFFWRWDKPEKFRTNLRAYYRMISGIDGVIARVRGKLAEKKLDTNTVIIFSGDNGYYEGQRGFAGKWSHYEESLRVPLIIYDPRAEKSLRGKVAAPMVLNIDIPATILGYAGIDVPAGYQGRSLVPLAAGRAPGKWRSDTFAEHLMNHSAIPKWEGVRGARYVYARYFEQKPVYEYLHDLEKDPSQLKNLVSDPGYAAVLKKLRSRCDELRDAYGGVYDPDRSRKPKAQRRQKKVQLQGQKKKEG